MERGWDTKLGDDLLEEKIRDSLSPFVGMMVGNASTHPDKVSTKTRMYLACLTVGKRVNSSCQRGNI